MGQKDIYAKIKKLIKGIESFEEKDVVYLLVELYKIKERDIEENGGDMSKDFPYLSFFRHWVTHTHLRAQYWIDRKDELDQPKKLVEQIQLIINNEETNKKIDSMTDVFFESLQEVIKDQDIIVV